MKAFRRIGIIILLVLVLIFGFMLPTIAATFQDNQTDDTRETVNATQIQLDMSSTLTLLQKLWILSDRTSSVRLDSAQKMDENEAYQALSQGLVELFPDDNEEIPFSVDDFTEVNHTINLKMSGELSLIYWEFLLTDEEGDQITATVDDDAGLILSLTYSLASVSVEEEPEEPLVFPQLPLFANQDMPENTGGSIFATNGIFAGLEEMGSSAQAFAEVMQKQYCDVYLHSQGYYLNWEVDTSEPEDNGYLYSVMAVDNAGGYYVLPFTVTNSEIIIN